MKPVDMIQMADKERGIRGDCFRACVASLLELPAAAVPHFLEVAERQKKCWEWITNDWLTREHGLLLITLPVKNDGYGYYMPHGLHDSLVGWFPSYNILSGPAIRGFRHSCVGLGSKIVHDPHPSRAGLQYVDQMDVLVRWNKPEAEK
jgi:hypothetical protein